MDDLCHEDQKNNHKRKKGKRIISKYTQEEKIVMAVWYHEKPHTRITLQELADNFRVRFNKKPPKAHSMLLWERSLFTYNSIKRKDMKKRSKGQYMQVPYVKESFRTHPHLTIKQRALLIGLTPTTLYQLIKEDITAEEIERLKQEGQNDTKMGNQEIEASSPIEESE